ncbi:MAG: M48 family metalloprotease, partial [Helicobacteraceae bacterium]|nr:M48 family metalloprotease [Helicobacteraceae bacterium]
MNFREGQRLARRSSRRFIAFFSLSVFAVIFSIWYFGAALNNVMQHKPIDHLNKYESDYYKTLSSLELAAKIQAEYARCGGKPCKDDNRGFFINPISLFSQTNGGINLLLIVFAISMIAVGGSDMAAKLNGDGNAVAKMLSARLASRANASEKRLINIVEEMALASSVTPPNVYILSDAESINALAAGDNPEKSAIVVTKGALRYLNRDELQGVIAHEFSHILNEDIKLNMRSAYLLYGIAYISQTGAIALRERDDEEGNPLLILIFIFCLTLFIIGIIGEIFAAIAKSGLNKQREFLADASAVQFTRQIDGVAGALKKIGGLKSAVKAPFAPIFSHFFFAQGVINIFGSHPSLRERIKRIDPSWDGRFITPTALTDFSDETKYPKSDDQSVDTAALGFDENANNEAVSKARKEALERGIFPLKTTPRDPSSSGFDKTSFIPIALKGAKPAEELSNARDRSIDDPLSIAKLDIESIPPFLRDQASEALSARWIIYALLIDQKDEATAKRQKDIINERVYIDSFEAIVTALELLERASVVHLIFLCVLALKSLAKAQYIHFRNTADLLIEADGRVSLFEFNLKYLVFYPLDIAFDIRKPPKITYFGFYPIAKEIATILSAIAYDQFKDDG